MMVNMTMMCLILGGCGESEDDSTEHEIAPLMHLTTDKVKMGILAVVFLIGMPLNTLFLYRQLKQYRATTRGHRYTMAMAYSLQKIHLNVSNLLMIAVFCPGHFFWVLTYRWMAGEFMCKFCTFLFKFVFHLASNVVTVIAIERLRNVLKVHSVRQGGLATKLMPTTKAEVLNPVKCMLVVAWLMAAFLSSPLLLIRTTVEVMPDWVQCKTIWDQQKIQIAQQNILDAMNEQKEGEFKTPPVRIVDWHLLVSLVDLLGVFWIPLSIIVICYSIIVVIEFDHYRSLLRRDKQKDDTKTIHKNQLNPLSTALLSVNECQRKDTTLNGSAHLSPSRPSPMRDPCRASSCDSDTPMEDDCLVESSISGILALTVGPIDQRKRSQTDPQTSPKNHISEKHDEIGVLGNTTRVSFKLRDSRTSLIFKARRRTKLSSAQFNRGRQTERALILSRTLVKSSMAIIGLYVITWIPYNLLALALLVDKTMYTHMDMHLDWMNSLILLNAIVSPFLYSKSE